MIYYVSANAFRSGNGSKESPFKTINEAAQIARPGDEVLVAPGLSTGNMWTPCTEAGRTPGSSIAPRSLWAR